MIKRLIYPNSKIHKQYNKYIFWNFLSNIIVSIENVISTHSILSTIGQSNQEIVITSNYIMKDLIGQIGGLYFIDKLGTRIDKNPQKFGKYATILQQSAFIAESLTPIFGHNNFIYIAAPANICKNISFTCFGAINAKVIQKLAMDNNIGEIYAKISIMNTMASTIGMGLGLLTISKYPDHNIHMGLMPILAGLRIYTFNKSIKYIL